MKLILIVGLVIILSACSTRQATTSPQDNTSASTTPVESPTGPARTGAKQVDYFGHLNPEHRDVLRAWLKTKPTLRPAVEEVDSSYLSGKDSTEENKRFVRETLGRDGYQYYSVGDMNQDGNDDFAVLLVDTNHREEESEPFALAIFNGPIKRGNEPAYYEDGLNGIGSCFIVFNRITTDHLHLGQFESDAVCATYYPKKNTYYFKDCEL